MHLGLTRTHLRRVSVVGAILGITVFAAGYVGVLVQGTPITGRRLLLFLASAAAIGAILPTAILVASVLHIDILGDEMRQTLFGRWIVGRQPLRELVEIRVGGRARTAAQRADSLGCDLQSC